MLTEDLLWLRLRYSVVAREETLDPGLASRLAKGDGGLLRVRARPRRQGCCGALPAAQGSRGVRAVQRWGALPCRHRPLKS